MSTSQIQSLNAEIANEHINMPYPHLLMVNPNDAVALVLPTLPAGELPVICTYKGSTRQMAKIRKSALAISPLSKIVQLQFVRSKNDVIDIKTPSDIMEVLV